MPTGEHAVANAAEIDLDTFGTDVNQHDLETTDSSVQHHLQVAVAGERSFDGEALAVLDVVFRCAENLASRGDGYGGS